ncbi:porin family protein [uncultured Winogradskyella sp.]|uniref:porin family protein n=1 Tax=uncultured Winogradskyella sp. TaxID=395353 RepID=UPI0035118F74
MKRLLLVIFAVLAFTSLSAQSFRLGVKAGPNFASVNGDDTEDVDGRTSIHFGAVAEFGISEAFSVQPELLYNSVGATSSYTDTFSGMTFNVHETLKLNYLSLPIMAKYKVAKGLSLEAGPQISFLLSADEEVEVDSESVEVDVSDFVKSVDFGLGFGASYELDMGLFFTARYMLGLSNINDFEGDFTNRNNVLQLSVGYFFL